jgi:hypothetical protein
VRVSPSADLQSASGRAIRIDEETARRLGVGPGAVVELVNPRGAPLRAWVSDVTPGDGRRAQVDAAAVRMLSNPGGELEIRAVHSGALDRTIASR